MSPTATDEIPCEEIAARAVNRDQLTNSEPRLVHKGAFIPRKNGKDNAGLSVSLVRPGTLGFLRQRLGVSLKEAVTLNVGRVRQVSADEYVLNVVADPVEGDAYHALIVGFPPRRPDETESFQNKAAWNRLAELLAVQARCCLEA
jgi:hypothetical protein